MKGKQLSANAVGVHVSKDGARKQQQTSAAVVHIEMDQIRDRNS